MTTKLAVLFRGGGRTILNILDFIERGELDAKIVLAIASRNDISGIERLADRGIDVAVAKHEGDDAQTVDGRVQAWLEETEPDLI